MFFDPNELLNATARASKGKLSIAGRNVRTTARRSMRKPRQKRLGDLTKEERRQWRIAVSMWERGGKQGPRPRRPSMPSKPGTPPRVKRGDLKKHLYYIFDKSTKSVVIGPAKYSPATGAPKTLEFGGRSQVSNGRGMAKVAKRPYMRPALKKEKPKLAALWRGAIKK